MTFLTASSFFSIFTQVPKTFNSTVASQGGFFSEERLLFLEVDAALIDNIDRRRVWLLPQIFSS